MRKLFLLVLVLLYPFASLPLFALEESVIELDHIVITELQTGSSALATEEFVELYNPTDETIDATDWLLRYITASGATASTKAILAGMIEPRAHYLLATESYLGDLADTVMGGGLAQPGGHILLVKPASETEAEIVIDKLGWGTATQPETTAALAPTAGESLKRQVDEDALFIDTDDNFSNFAISDTPEPQGAPPSTEDPPDDPPGDLPDDTPPSVTYLSMIINELFPDPSAPQTDAANEFVELYNPHDQAINLTGYKVQFGPSLSSSYTLPAVSVPAGGYYVVTSAATTVNLSNDGSRIQLLDPNGSIAGSLVTYDEAKPGQSWSLLGGNFVWTTIVTPGAANQASGVGNEGPALPTTKPATSAKNYARLTITEVFPDPDDPLKDADDEFVELYNPNSFAVNVADYRIKTGSTLRSSCKPANITIAPGTYAAFFSSDCSMSLSNAGGSAQLVDGNGTVLFEVEPYGKAVAGETWALIGGTWQWTAKPTPAAANALVASAGDSSASGKGGSSNSSSSEVLGTLSQPAALTTPPNWRLIAGVSVLAAGYMIYELRHDLRNQYFRFKRAITAKMGK